jgi:hypothetical protein
MKYFILIVFIPSLAYAQVQVPKILERAPTSPTSTEGTGPTLGGAMGGDSSLYGPPRGNDFPAERMEDAGIIESFDDPLEDNRTPNKRNDHGRIPSSGQTIPGVTP